MGLTNIRLLLSTQNVKPIVIYFMSHSLKIWFADKGNVKRVSLDGRWKKMISINMGKKGYTSCFVCLFLLQGHRCSYEITITSQNALMDTL